MYEWQANAFLMKPGKVLDKQLQPLTVGHAFLLESIKSPFYVGGNYETGDLVLAVWICSMTFADACKFLSQPPADMEKQAKQWGKLASKTRCNVIFDAAQFTRYIAEYCKMPDAWIDPDPVKAMTKRESAYPLAMRVAWCLMAHGIPEKAAYDMPMNRALQYYGIEGERNGQQFVTDEEDSVIDNLPESGAANG